MGLPQEDGTGTRKGQGYKECTGTLEGTEHWDGSAATRLNCPGHGKDRDTRKEQGHKEGTAGGSVVNLPL